MRKLRNYSYLGSEILAFPQGNLAFTPCASGTVYNTLSSYFRLLSCNVLGEDEHRDQLDTPLELSDIMPLASKTYDKMRPPKYKGKNFFL